MEEVPHFCYSSKDVSSSLAEKRNSGLPSKLELLLNERWELAVSRGAFRYDLSGVTTRKVPGLYGFVLLCNPKRHTHRRMPASMSSLVQPFNPSLFNFNKIKPEEILFELLHTSEAEDERDGSNEEKGGCSTQEEDPQRHLVVANVSPITYGHALVIPHPKACLPQVWTRSSIQLCLDLVALTNPNGGFCVVANSLLAYASVNHLHYHMLYVKEPVLSATVRGVHLKGAVYSLSDHPSPAFGFQVTSSTSACAQRIYGVVELLLELGIPHNMVILWGSPFDQEKSSDAPIIRAILVPRKPVYGEKVMCGSDGPPFSAAACELVQGFIPVLNEQYYHGLQEPDILKVLQDKMLPQEEFQHLLDKVKALTL